MTKHQPPPPRSPRDRGAAPAASDAAPDGAGSLRDVLKYFLTLGTVRIRRADRARRLHAARSGRAAPLDHRRGLRGRPGARPAGAGAAGGAAGHLSRLGRRAACSAPPLVAAAFILPSFVMVLALSALYVRFGGLPWMQSAFYGIGAAVIAIIARSALKLVKLTLAKDRLLWALFVGQRGRHRLDRVRDRLAVPRSRRRRAVRARAVARGWRPASASLLPPGLLPAVGATRTGVGHDAWPLLARSRFTSPRPAPSSSAAGWPSCRSSTAAWSTSSSG